MEVKLDVSLVRNKFVKAKLCEEETRICHSQCPLCEGVLIPFIRLINGRGNVVVERSVCPECTFVTLTKMPIQQWFQTFYAKSWDQRRSLGEIEAKLANTYKELLEVVLPHLKSTSAKIFEIGVGYGACLYQFQKSVDFTTFTG